MTMGGEVKAFLSEEQLQGIKEDWALFQNSPESNWELYWGSLRNRGEGAGPYVLAVRDDSRLSGMLMGRSENGHADLRFGYWRLFRMPVKNIVIQSVQTLPPGDGEGLLRQMALRVVDDLRRGVADAAVFDCVPEDSALHRVLNGIDLPRRMRDNVPKRQIHWHLNLPATFNEYQKKHKGFMQKVRKFERAYEGRFLYRLFTAEAEIDDFCSAADAVARKTYQRALGVGFLNSAEDRGKIKAASAQGAWLAFVEFVDGKAVAFWSGCRFGSSVFLWWTAYDTDFQEFSPGLVSLARMAERLIGEGITDIDFGVGDAAYKERLCNESRWEETVCIYAPTSKGMLARGVRSLDAALGNLTRTRLKGLANRLKTPWRRMMAQRMSKQEGKGGGESTAPKSDGDR